MYEQSAKWNMFYRELEPAKRREMFDELQMTEPDDGANEYRKRLLEARYTDPKEPEREVDHFLWQCLNLPYLYKSAKLMSFGSKKEVKKVLDALCAGEAKEYGESGEKAFYWEMRNAAGRYFSTCGGRNYRRKFFGLLSASEEEQVLQTCKDAWEMSCGIARRVGLEDEMKVFCQAVRDEYTTVDDGAAARFEEYDKEHTKK